MMRPLRVLHVEDAEGDAALVERALVRGGYQVLARRVEAAAEMLDALHTGEWDIVIADYALPQFGALAALRLLQAEGLDLPFIVVSGTIGEEVAVEMMRAGAHDYVMKGRLDRLSLAIDRELRDVEARRARARAQDELHALESQYHAAIETSPDAFCVLDLSGRILAVNRAFVEQTGDAAPSIVGRNIADLEAPGGSAALAVHLGRIVDTGRERFETRLRTGDGGAWDADLSVSYLPAGGGRLFVFARDVTGQKQTASKIRRFIAGSPAVIYALRGHGPALRLVWVSDNVRAFTGHTLDAIDDDWWEKGLHPDDRERVLAGQAQLQRDDHQISEYRFRHQDGHYLWVRDERRVFPEPDGDGYEIIGSWVDVTARVLLEQQYRHAQKMEAVGRLAGGVAHDFNNLLTVIIGYGNLLLHESLPPETARAHVEQICVAAERASRLTRQLLAFSRKQVLELRVVDLNGIVLSVEKMLRRLIGEDVQVVTALAGDVPPVKVDPGQVEQAIINLVVNARDAMPDGGRLEIGTGRFVADETYCLAHPDHQSGLYARLTVRDSGRGMTPEVRARLFEPFFTTKELGKGTGLGLATVFGIVKQFDGAIDVWSEPDAGACFTIDLPASTTWPSTGADPDSRVKPFGTETILLVEDEESVRQVARLTLEAYGYEVLVANDGVQALGIAEQHRGRIRLVVTDVVMPGLSGRDVIARLREAGVVVKALFMSGYIDDAVVRHGLVDEQAPFLQKPFTPRALALKVREVLDGSGSPN